ncbi:neural-cadherin 2-like 3 [Homarus americanus]|uniref:Neural-cadherin 2-like 3 n=1 Tax=Homarus americanus TaxID=6706 RepID=A0A8J5JS65_HOMAM|nr:neural-cadherin 2-like 3 [Homarus americanus]
MKAGRYEWEKEGEGAPLTFRITEGNEEGSFRLDSSSGRLSLLTPLNYEDQNQQSSLVEGVNPISWRSRGGEGEKEEGGEKERQEATEREKRGKEVERERRYDLAVEARTGEARSEAKVVVRVLDENDHAPVFPRLLHETQITEEDDRHLPKTILTVTATDGDGAEHGQLHYSLSGDGVYPNGTSCFSVDPVTGAVLLLRV